MVVSPRDPVAVAKEVDRFISSIHEPIKQAAKIGNWSGLGGVQEYLESDVMKALANKGPRYHKVAMAKCFSVMCEGALEGHDIGMSVITEFAKSFPRVVKALVEENPQLFQNPEVANAVSKAPKGQKALNAIQGQSAGKGA